jgi:hypothetical protein
VLLVEYRGYGGNPGSPTEDGLAADVRAAYQYLVEERGIDPGRSSTVAAAVGASYVKLSGARHNDAILVSGPPAHAST